MVGKELAVRRELLHAGEPDVGPRVQRGDELGEGAVDDLGVRVEEEHVAGVAGDQRPVVRVGEAVVAAGRPHAPRETATRPARGAVGGLVVGDDDVEVELAGVGEDRREAGSSQRPRWSRRR